MKPETERWVKLAEGDLEMASAALERELYSPCMFHCQQALEKLLKAIWVEKASAGVPPRKHDLVELAQEVDLELSQEWIDFLADLYGQYNPSRYGDVAVAYSRDEGENYYQRTSELFGWLRQQLS